MKNKQWRGLAWLLVSALQFWLVACATEGIMDGDNYPAHSFSFDARHDSPDVEVLDYQYSNSRHAGVRPERERILMGETFPYEGIFGSILRGDFLYVKWRIKKTGQVYEDKVDLKSRLPEDITNLRIHFVIRGPQLYVYLIWPYDAKHPYPHGELKGYDRQKQVRIYPDSL